MRPFTTNVVAPLLPAALAMWSPGAAVAQATSAHPASVSLTVVVPARASSVAPMVNGETLRVVRRGPHAIDIETSIGIIDRPATRVEVSLGRARPRECPTGPGVEQSRRVGATVPNERVIALDRPAALAAVQPSVRFHVESDRRWSNSLFDLPVEYRVRTGSGDAVSTWTFASSVRLDAAP
jgi:hypothetical protein